MKWINDILRGFASIALFPNTDYADCYHHSDEEAIAEAWRRTGEDLYAAIQKFDAEQKGANKNED